MIVQNSQKATQEVGPSGQGLISESPGELLLGLMSGNTTQETAGTGADVCAQNFWAVSATVYTVRGDRF